ncbi:MAG TPA: sugar kinase [Acidobacteriaceae bacterium]|nr:sugar kinase [Acidobacteriaceae bacterium]
MAKSSQANWRGDDVTTVRRVSETNRTCLTENGEQRLVNMDPIVLREGGARWEQISLGEVMLRLDPMEGRIHTTRHFAVWEGGGEYNVARGLRRCFGMKTAIATALADNPVGRLVEDLILQGGVDPELVRWVPYDGVGRTVRNGLNFTERGFGVRAAAGCSDRGHTAIAQATPATWDWENIFGDANGARWFHTGGIFASLSETTPTVAVAAMDAARRHGTPISYDLNYRESLWKSIGGKAKAQEVNRELVRKVDVLLGNEEDFSAMLGISVEGVAEDYAELHVPSYERMLRAVAAAYPNVKLVATTLRTAHTATRNAWGALALYGGEVVHVPQREIEILDRVGGGDSFASGLIYGLLKGKPVEWALRCGVAHGALAMTTPGDTSMATLGEVERVMKGESARIAR